MSKCNINKIVAQKIAPQKLTNLDEVDFTISRDIDACAKINTKNYIAEKSKGDISYDRLLVPDDLLNVCESFGCKNTGTLESFGSGNNPVNNKAVFKSATDATKYSAGVMTFYAYFGGYATTAGNYKVKIADIAEPFVETESEDFTDNYNEYTGTITFPENGGFALVVVDLSQGTAVGNGWEATPNGVKVSIEVDSGTNTGRIMGISSISLFESIMDLEGNDVVKLGCLQTIGGDDTADPLETSCFGSGYDEESVSVTRSLTAQSWTPNVYKLNALISRGEKTEGYIMDTVEVTVPNDGKIILADAYRDQCGMVYVALNDSCNVTDAVLNRVNVGNSGITLDSDQFAVETNVENGIVVRVATELAGKVVVVSYPRQVEGEHFVANTNTLNDRKVTLTYKKPLNDGTIEVFIYHNVLITSFPMTISKSDTDFEFGVSIQKDRNGNYYEYMRINRANAYI